MLIFHARAICSSPGSNRSRWSATHTAAGVPGRVEIVAGAGHGFDEANQDRAVRATLEFFAEKLPLERQ